MYVTEAGGLVMRRGRVVRRRDVEPDELEARLRRYEARYGVPSDRFVEAFIVRGRLVETEDFHDWSQALQLTRLVGGRA